MNNDHSKKMLLQGKRRHVMKVSWGRLPDGATNLAPKKLNTTKCQFPGARSDRNQVVHGLSVTTLGFIQKSP